MYSMTGYGRAEYVNENLNLVIEVKTVNNRNLDVNIKAPRALIGFEDLLRKCVQDKLKRGRADVFVTFIDNREKDVKLTVDYSLADGYVSAAKSLSEKFGLVNDYTVSQVMRVPDVVKDAGTVDTLDGLEDVLRKTTNDALDALNGMRAAEGEKLKADMTARMAEIKATVDKLKERAPKVKEDYAEKLKARITEALDGVNYDEARLLNEVAFFADKSNIDEEITRLYSHISQFYSLMKTDGAGKQIDFLIQEFNREANTVCSKANDIEITACGLKLKCEIEKIREQVQNVE